MMRRFFHRGDDFILFGFVYFVYMQFRMVIGMQKNSDDKSGKSELERQVKLLIITPWSGIFKYSCITQIGTSLFKNRGVESVCNTDFLLGCCAISAIELICHIDYYTTHYNFNKNQHNINSTRNTYFKSYVTLEEISGIMIIDVFFLIK